MNNYLKENNLINNIKDDIEAIVIITNDELLLKLI